MRIDEEDLKEVAEELLIALMQNFSDGKSNLDSKTVMTALEGMFDRGYDEGYDLGYDDGHTDGYSDGYEDGHRIAIEEIEK